MCVMAEKVNKRDKRMWQDYQTDQRDLERANRCMCYVLNALIESELDKESMWNVF